MIMVNREKELIGIRGWLLVYVVVLGLLTVHTIGLTVASVIIYNKAATAGLATLASLKASSPLSSVLFYDITSVLLIIYAVVLYILMFRRRKAAICSGGERRRFRRTLSLTPCPSCFWSPGTSPDKNLTSAHSTMRCLIWLAFGTS